MTAERFQRQAEEYVTILAALAPRWSGASERPPPPRVHMHAGEGQTWEAIVPAEPSASVATRIDVARALGLMIVPGARSDTLYAPREG